MSLPSRSQMKTVLAWLPLHRAELDVLVQGIAIILSNPAVRGIVNFLLSVIKPPQPVLLVKDETAAAKFLSENCQVVQPWRDIYDQRSVHHPRPHHPRSTDPRSMDPRSIDPRSTDPRSMDPRSTDPCSTDPCSSLMPDPTCLCMLRPCQTTISRTPLPLAQRHLLSPSPSPSQIPNSAQAEHKETFFFHDLSLEQQDAPGNPIPIPPR